MKVTKFLAIVVGLTCVMSQAYFYEDFGKQTTPEERMKEKEIDLNYEGKVADAEYKKQKTSKEVALKKEKLELERKKARLKAERQ